MQGWVDSRKCLSDETLFSEARKCITRCNLRWLKRNWDPADSLKCFNSTLLTGKKRPKPEHRKLYEWVEDQVDQDGFIEVKEVREKASILIGSSFAKYKKFRSLGDRIKSLLNLQSEGNQGKQTKWIPK